MLRATETVLGDAGGDWELFATEVLEEVPLGEVEAVVQAVVRQRAWDWELRRTHFQEDDQLRWEEGRDKVDEELFELNGGVWGTQWNGLGLTPIDWQ